jgi:hypothetical protein
MSPDTSGKKFCTVCGVDCSTKPRTKDPKGHYYCKECYDTVKSQRSGAVAHGRAHPPKPKPQAVPPQRAELDGPMDLLGDLIPDAPPVQAAMAAQGCPGCGAAIHTAAVMCTNCGYNLQTHSAAGRTRVQKAPRQPTGGVIWPPIVGMVSMVLGGLGALAFGLLFVLSFLGAINAGVFLPAMVTIFPMTCLPASLSAWLFRDGLRILRHDSDGVKWIRYWAMAMMLLFGTCLSLVMAVPARDMDRGLAQVERQTGRHISGGDIKGRFALVMGLILSWPAFTMVFFFIPRIQADVEQWD